ncbi:Alpha-ketoglutarate-dependent dioxygenase FTO [Liparis tanakae]|uniref:Alpha-ketoglutarate-dependent dioxygenase FTO n=1 Tax=Liparis tanakae TaxID=230148 RepID=A0A4Z2F346_9TELE|nr:Alpha-ketoglutarate-dependent dioxygenase FTO [Liparis tanakae]
MRGESSEGGSGEGGATSWRIGLKVAWDIHTPGLTLPLEPGDCYYMRGQTGSHMGVNHLTTSSLPPHYLLFLAPPYLLTTSSVGFSLPPLNTTTPSSFSSIVPVLR